MPTNIQWTDETSAISIFNGLAQQIDYLTVEAALFGPRPGHKGCMQIRGQANQDTDDFFNHADSIYHLDTTPQLCYHNDTISVSDRGVQVDSKVCPHCRQDLARSAFAKDRTTFDGLTGWCSHCRNEAARLRHVPKASPRTGGPQPDAPRDGDVRQARKRVNQLVLWGKIPHPNELLCADCGHLWQIGERRHEYDHYLGYGAQHHLDVEPVCTTCHHARERYRLGGIA